jgi:predicted acetylornithine/succinylornithine family transaminase
MNLAIEQTGKFVAQTYRRPNFTITRGEGMYVWDEDGNRYLDMVAGIAVMSLGHSDPQITQIIKEQAEQLVQVSNLYFTEPQARLAALLCEKSFADRVYFCNSGAEANEACLKFARKFAYMNNEPRRKEYICFTGAFHGRTIGALSVTPKPQFQDPFRPLLEDVTALPLNDLEAVKAAISEKTCAIIVEPIQGEGGVNPADEAFIQGLRHLCDEHGALLIFDEIQTGVGRTGKLWAYEHFGVTPDLMSLAKPLASGLPIGAALMTERVHGALAVGDHGSTFAAGPLVCAVAEHVLTRISQPGFLAHVQEVSQYLMERLQEINSPHIQEIRGRGLMVGIGLDFPSMELVQAGYDAGLLLVGAGPDTLRFVPPLIIEESHVDVVVDAVTTMLQKRN